MVAVALFGAALTGCGGGDDGESDADRAEAVVKDQLTAIDENNVDDFCATLTPGYARTFTRQIATFTKSDLKRCADAFRKARSLSDTPTFEGKELAGTDIDELDFKTSVNGSKATVRGPEGVARYELVLQGGEWKIDRAKAN
jgi:hypothetical protein